MDDPVGLHLPFLTNFISNGFNKGVITLRQCFANTCGLVETSGDFETDPDLTLEQSVQLIASNTPVVFAPGTQLAYEGDGMQIAGRVCEVVTGKDWSNIAREYLFDPLGMTNSDYNFFPLNPGIPGGAQSTADDYLRFLRMIAKNGMGSDGRLFLSSRSIQEFFKSQTLGLPEYYR